MNGYDSPEMRPPKSLQIEMKLKQKQNVKALLKSLICKDDQQLVFLNVANLINMVVF